jgi:hypothetical protein
MPAVMLKVEIREARYAGCFVHTVYAAYGMHNNLHPSPCI